MTFTLYDEFAGIGGSSQGATAVPGVELMLAANHNPLAVDVHGINFPDADHYCGDIAKADIAGFPRADLFWSSPSCPPSNRWAMTGAEHGRKHPQWLTRVDLHPHSHPRTGTQGFQKCPVC